MYSPVKTVLKAATPAIVPIVGEIIEAISEDVPEKKAYLIGVLVLSLIEGLKNWIKNRKR